VRLNFSLLAQSASNSLDKFCLNTYLCAELGIKSSHLYLKLASISPFTGLDILANHAKINLVASFAMKNHMELEMSTLKKITQNVLIIKVITYLLPMNVSHPIIARHRMVLSFASARRTSC